mgnify:CR=1 FL=1
MPIEQRLFNVITIGGIFAGTVSTLIGIILQFSILSMIETTTVFLILLYLLYRANKNNKFDKAALMVCVGVNLILFPMIYFANGGMHSGMPLWFVLGVVFDFMLLEGKRFYIALFGGFLAVVLCAADSVLSLHIISFIPRTTFNGVRISWLIFARKSRFAWFAASACSIAISSWTVCSSRWKIPYVCVGKGYGNRNPGGGYR